MGIPFELLNQTEGTFVANNVAVQGTATKQYAGGFSNEIGATWASNFNCVDLTGRVNPTHSCLGAELDVQALASAGTDANRQRVALQLAWFATNMMGTSSLHFGVGMLMGSSDASVMDHGIYFGGNGTYGNLATAVASSVNGINLNGATFSGAAYLSPGFAVSGTGAIAATLPTSAGGGGLAVCVDTSGIFYRKATCP